MKMNLKDLKDECATLPAEDRADLAYFLLHTLDDEEPGDEEGAAKAWEIEIERRMEDVLAGRVTGRDVKEISAELREKCRENSPDDSSSRK